MRQPSFHSFSSQLQPRCLQVVHLQPSGVNWEPTPNRVLVADLVQEPAEPGTFGLDVNCQWSCPDATLVSPLTR